jgi:hypothetical protein
VNSGVGRDEEPKTTNPNTRVQPQLESEPGAPCAFLRFVMEEQGLRREGECFEDDMGLLTIVVITSIMREV